MGKSLIASHPESGPQPTTDFKRWSVPTWECFGDTHGNTCDPRWKCPEHPRVVGQKERFLERIWRRLLFLSIIVFL
jgi:hypothetical protein